MCAFLGSPNLESLSADKKFFIFSVLIFLQYFKHVIACLIKEQLLTLTNILVTVYTLSFQLSMLQKLQLLPVFLYKVNLYRGKYANISRVAKLLFISGLRNFTNSKWGRKIHLQFLLDRLNLKYSTVGHSGVFFFNIKLEKLVIIYVVTLRYRQELIFSFISKILKENLNH